jgi:putative AlgH/UPF0301 family transcriptional regulator
LNLNTLFPEHAPSREVVDPVYLGGPLFFDAVFAVARRVPDGSDQVIAMMPGLVAVIDGETLFRVIETTPNDARYFVGLMLWIPGELDEEIRAGAWEVRPADIETVFNAHPAGLWKELSRGAARMIEARLERLNP